MSHGGMLAPPTTQAFGTVLRDRIGHNATLRLTKVGVAARVMGGYRVIRFGCAVIIRHASGARCGGSTNYVSKKAEQPQANSVSERRESQLRNPVPLPVLRFPASGSKLARRFKVSMSILSCFLPTKIC